MEGTDLAEITDVAINRKTFIEDNTREFNVIGEWNQGDSKICRYERREEDCSLASTKEYSFRFILLVNQARRAERHFSRL